MKSFQEFTEEKKKGTHGKPCWTGYRRKGVNDCVKVSENFADGRNPQDKGDMARHGLRGKSISQLKAIRSSSSATPRQKQLAHWYINMHSEDKNANN